MNNSFNEKQIEAYAAAFREGDAIWCDGKWRKVFENSFENSDELTTNSLNQYVIRNIFDDVVTDGFNCSVTPYRVTTLEDYVLRGGEKIVWLGESDRYRTFGKVYTTFHAFDAWGRRYITYTRDDEELSKPNFTNPWGVIPSYEQVTKESKESATKRTKQNEVDSIHDSESTDIIKALHKRYKNNLKTLLQNDILGALKQEDYFKVAELSKLMAELKKQS